MSYPHIAWNYFRSNSFHIMLDFYGCNGCLGRRPIREIVGNIYSWFSSFCSLLTARPEGLVLLVSRLCTGLNNRYTPTQLLPALWKRREVAMESHWRMLSAVAVGCSITSEDMHCCRALKYPVLLNVCQAGYILVFYNVRLHPFDVTQHRARTGGRRAR